MKYFLIFLLAFFSFFPRTFAVSEFLPYAEMLVENAIISPQTSEAGYRLSSTITRAEMAKLTMLLSGLEQNDCHYISTYTFPDVDKSYGDLCGYIEGAALNEIIQSGNGVKFRPKQNVTRAELAKMFLSGIGESPIEESVGYNDVTSSLGNLAGYVNALGTIGCAQLTSSFRPNATATRGEAFKMAACVIGLYDPTGSTETGTTDTSGTYNLQVYNSVDTPVQSGQTARVIGSFSFKANGSTGTFTSLAMASVGTVDLLTTINTVDLYQGSTRIGTASVGHNTLTFNGFSITLPKDTLTYFTIKANIIGTGSSPIALQIPTSSSIGITYANGGMTPNDSYPVDFPSVYFNSSLGSITLLQWYASGVGLVAGRSDTTLLEASTYFTTNVKVGRVTWSTNPTTAYITNPELYLDNQLIGSFSNGIYNGSLAFSANTPRTLRIIADVPTGAVPGTFTGSVVLSNLIDATSGRDIADMTLALSGPRLTIAGGGIELATASPGTTANKLLPNPNVLQEIGRFGLIARGSDARVAELYLTNMSGTLNIADIATEVFLEDVSAGVRVATGTITGKTVYFTGMSLILGRDSTKTYKVMLRAKQYHQIYYNYPIQLWFGVGTLGSLTGVVNGVKGTTIASGAITEVSGTPAFAGYLLASVTPPFLNMWHKGNGVVQLDFLTLDDSVAMSIEWVTLKVNILSGTTTGGAVVLRTLGTGSLISNLGTLTSTASQRLDFIAGQTVSLTPPSRRTDSRDLYLDLSGISTWQPVQITIEKIHYNNGDEGIDTNSVKTLTIYK